MDNAQLVSVLIGLLVAAGSPCAPAERGRGCRVLAFHVTADPVGAGGLGADGVMLERHDFAPAFYGPTYCVPCEHRGVIQLTHARQTRTTTTELADMKRLLLTLIAMVAVLACGCGGFTASKSISPLDFLLPGLMHIGAPPAPLPAPSDAPQVPETLALAWTCCNPDPNSPFNGYWGEGLNVKPHVLTIETTSMGRTAPKDNIHPHSDLGSLALNSIF